VLESRDPPAFALTVCFRVSESSESRNPLLPLKGNGFPQARDSYLTSWAACSMTSATARG
jgi:hypothetical protein